MLSDRDQELIAAARDAIKRRYRNDWQEVGAAVRTRDGRIYTGVNPMPISAGWRCAPRRWRWGAP